MVGCWVVEFSPWPRRCELAYQAIPSVKGENLGFSFVKALVVFDLFMLINPIHQLTHIPRWFHDKRFP